MCVWLSEFVKVEKIVTKFFCIYVKSITLCNCLCSSSPSSCDFNSATQNIGKFGAKNYFTDHQTTNTRHGLEIQSRSLKQMAITRIHKNLSYSPFPQGEISVLMYSYNPLQTALKHLKLYILAQIVWEISYYIADKCLVSICSKISEIWLILWMVYACSVKGLEEVEKLSRLVEMNVLCIADQDHQWWVIAVDHTSKFKVI